MSEKKARVITVLVSVLNSSLASFQGRSFNKLCVCVCVLGRGVQLFDARARRIRILY